MGNKKKITVAGIVCLLMVSMVGCGASGTSESYSGDISNQAFVANKSMPQEEIAPEAIAEDVMAPAEAGDSSQQSQTALTQTNRKLIKNISMRVETDQYEVLVPVLEQEIEKLGGYIENLNERKGSNYQDSEEQRNVSIVARIPKEKSTSFVEKVEGQSNVVSRSESVEDVTLQYVDVESHKKMLQTEQESLLRLLETAEKIEDIITIEGRLSEVRYQIESMESTLRTYDNLVDYDTVTIDIREVVIYTQQPQLTALEKITTGLQTNCYKIMKGLKSFGIWFVITIPYFILWGIIIFVVIVIVRAVRKARQKRKMKKQAQKQVPVQNPIIMQNQIQNQTTPEQKKE